MVVNKADDHGFIKDKPVDKPKVNMPAPVPAVAPSQVGIQAPVPNKDLSIKPVAHSSTWIYPPLNLLADVAQKEADRGDVNTNADTIEKTLDSFGIRARVAEVNFGPTVTQYALEITMGTKLSRITSLGNDLALALAAPTGQVRIEAPIPGRSMVGIEIPNRSLRLSPLSACSLHLYLQIIPIRCLFRWVLMSPVSRRQQASVRCLTY